jgi:predicted Zn-dependent protease
MKSTSVTIAGLSTLMLLIGCAQHPATSSPKTPSPTAIQPVAHAFEASDRYYDFVQAQLARKRGDLTQAIAHLKRAIAAEPHPIYLQRELATVYLQQKDLKKAQETLKTILKDHPDDIDTLKLYGRKGPSSPITGC